MTGATVADEERSLNLLLGWAPEKPPFPTSLVERAERALATPLNQLSVEQIRLLVGQQFGLAYVIPKALEILEADPFADGDLYEGDLLVSCLSVSADFWAKNPNLWVRLNGVLTDIDRTIETINKHRSEFVSRNPFGAAS